MKRTMLGAAAMGALTKALLAGSVLAGIGGAAWADEARCADSARDGMAAIWTPATDALPAYCEITGVLSPVEDSEIGVVYRLPADWNGKVLGLGGGGWLGNVTLEAAADGLARGYATLQTDGGHSIEAQAFDASEWALNPDGSLNQTKVEDFAWRAIHEMTQHGKAQVADYYGVAPQRSYYLGCSTGGRQGLMEAQRFPDDYDGIIAGAPVYTLQTQTSAVLRSNAFAAPGARLRPAHLDLINSAVLTACDVQDGAADGILRDPRQCDFDPRTLICQGAPKDTCLTRPQAQAVARVYEDQLLENGAVAAYALERGGEMEWTRFVPAASAGDPGANSGGLSAFRGPLFGDPEFDMADFSPEHVPGVRNSWFGQIYEAASPDLSAFAARGGRLILWHGFSDAGPSARGTVAYYEAALAATLGGADAVRLFLAPGVSHCRGGAGPDSVDWLSALEAWIEEGAAPQEIPATKADTGFTWNLCPYPQLPTGQGDGTYRCE